MSSDPTGGTFAKLRDLLPYNRVVYIVTVLTALAAFIAGIAQVLPNVWANYALVAAALIVKLVAALKALAGSQKWDNLVNAPIARAAFSRATEDTPLYRSSADAVATSSGFEITKQPKQVVVVAQRDEGELDDAVSGEVLDAIIETDPHTIPVDLGDFEAFQHDQAVFERAQAGHVDLLLGRAGVLLGSSHDRLTARRLAVEAAGLALAHAPVVHYTQGPERWEGIAHGLRGIRGQYPHHADCSAFVSWLLWTATRAWHLGDFASGEGWKAGYTGTLLNHGEQVTNGHFLLGDVALYGDPFGPSGHTALLVHARRGEPYVVSFGSEAGPFLLPLRYRPDLLMVRRLIR